MHRLGQRPHGQGLRRTVVALRSAGACSLSCYLAQSAVFVTLLPAWSWGLGAVLGTAQAAALALATWAGTVMLASAWVRRAGEVQPRRCYVAWSTRSTGRDEHRPVPRSESRDRQRSSLVVVVDIDWQHGAEHMWGRHRVVVFEADEAVADIDAVWFDPDPHSRSGRGVRVIGFSHSRRTLLTVILVHREGGSGYWGANGWESNNSDRRRYERGE